MARQPDISKERFWRRLFEQWKRSDLTVREFCAEHGVSVPSFYAWRTTIAERDRQTANARPGPGTRANSGHGAARFVPLRVLPPPTHTAIEVVLGPDRVVRVPVGFDAASLRQLLTILQEPPSC